MKEVSELIERVKKEDDVATAVTELRRIVGLDFGDGVDSASRRAWLNWWTHDRNNADKAADGVCDVVVMGKVTDPDGKPLADAGVLVDVPLAASPTGRYLLAQTRSDQQGRFVLAFGLVKWTPEGDSAIEATFIARKPPRYELKPSDVRKHMLANSAPDDIAKEDDTPETNAPIYPGKPVTLNFILHPKQ